MRIKILLICFLLSCLPAFADVDGTLAGAKAALRKNHKPIVYYPSMAKALPKLKEMAWDYEGMMMGNRRYDFLKDHYLIVIKHYAKRTGPASVRVKEELMFPVYSNRNDCHVLRYYIFTRNLTLTNGKYRALDGKMRSL